MIVFFQEKIITLEQNHLLVFKKFTREFGKQEIRVHVSRHRRFCVLYYLVSSLVLLDF